LMLSELRLMILMENPMKTFGMLRIEVYKLQIRRTQTIYFHQFMKIKPCEACVVVETSCEVTGLVGIVVVV
jgi:hypothetical protein